MRYPLSVFVYNMSSQYNTDIKNHVEAVAHSKLGVSNWLSRVASGRFTHFENLKTHGADYLLWKKFSHIVRRTTDPADADLFLVPILGGLNTILGWGHGLSRINAGAHRNILNWNDWATRNLHSWTRFPHRHILLYNMNANQVPPSMNSATVLHLGPSRTRSNHIIVPYLILEKAFFAPNGPVKDRSIFAYVQMTQSRNSIRKLIWKELKNRPGVLVDTRIIGKVQERTIRKMQQSVFCIAPAGDSASFCTRLYFALLSGCIPVRVDTYGSEDSYPFVGKGESLRELVVTVSPIEIRSHGLFNILHNVTNVQDKLYRIQKIRRYLLYHPSYDEEDAFTMIIAQLIKRKECADEFVTVRSLYYTHIGTSNDCSLPPFNFNEEMCWTCEIDTNHLLEFKQSLLQAAISC